MGPHQLKIGGFMARVTVEDCLTFVDNRFTLVHLATQRTKQLYRGAKRLLDSKNRESVLSLREIAEGKVRPTGGDGRKKH